MTGGGSGIGRCVAHELASLGATVVLSGRTRPRSSNASPPRSAKTAAAPSPPFDIRDEAVKANIAEVVAGHGAIHGLVNNAGGQFPAPLMAISKRGFDAVVANNLTGGFLMMREVFLQSMQQHGGAIVNMTADFRNGMPGMGHSGAARAGMSNLTMTPAFEWAHAGVRVNAVAPGWIASSGMDTLRRHARTRMIPQAARAAAPHGRGGRGQRGDLFLLSPARPSSPASRCRSTAARRWAARCSRALDHDKSVPFDGFHRAVLPEVLKGSA